MVQNEKKFLSVTLHISGTIHHVIVICGTHVWKDNISRLFLHFFKILVFGVNRRVKEQKMAQNDKKLCLSHSISQEAYITWSWFLIHMCRMISLTIFFIFSKFWFFWFLGGVKWEKMTHYSSLSHSISPEL